MIHVLAIDVPACHVAVQIIGRRASALAVRSAGAGASKTVIIPSRDGAFVGGRARAGRIKHRKRPVGAAQEAMIDIVIVFELTGDHSEVVDGYARVP